MDRTCDELSIRICDACEGAIQPAHSPLTSQGNQIIGDRTVLGTAGLFSCDIRGGMLDICIKRETIRSPVRCPMQDPATYQRPLLLAVENNARRVCLLPPEQMGVVLRTDATGTEKVACMPLQGTGCG